MQRSNPRAFSSADAPRFGWEKTRSNLKPLLIIGGIGAFLALLGDGLTQPAGGGASHVLLALALRILQTAVALAFVRAALTMHDGQELDLTYCSHAWLNASR